MPSEAPEKLGVDSPDWPMWQGVIRSMQQAVQDAIADHHRAGFPVVIQKNGKIQWLYPDGSLRDSGDDYPGSPLRSAAGEE